jgi:hypothetical protein
MGADDDDDEVDALHHEGVKFFVLFLESIELKSEEVITSGLDCCVHW